MSERYLRFNLRKIQQISALCIIVFFSVTIAPTGSPAAEPLRVYVVNYPLKYFAGRIGGEHVEVTFPAPADVDPAYWVPDVATITNYQQADLILLNGAGYAKWVKKVSLPRSRLIDTSIKFTKQYITSTEAVTHSHGPKGDHAHESLAFTTWLDLSLAARQAEAIAAAFSRKRPRHRSTFEKNLAGLKNDLLDLDSDLRRIVSRDPARPLVVSHPVYDYLARAYGMNIQSVHWEPDELPADDQWSDLLQRLKTHPARWMIWEAQPLGASVQRLKSIQLNSAVFDPCGNTPEKGDFVGVMRQNIDQLGQVYD